MEKLEDIRKIKREGEKKKIKAELTCKSDRHLHPRVENCKNRRKKSEEQNQTTELKVALPAGCGWCVIGDWKLSLKGGEARDRTTVTSVRQGKRMGREAE
nr:hypothetical protein Iba_chr07aCG11790 [Ipomoea batatas]